MISGVDVAYGPGVTVREVHGQLVIADGQGTRTYPRAGHGLRRVVIHGHSGMISLAAVRWCQHLGIPIILVGPDGQIQATTCYTQSGASATDGRLLRAQALAGDTRVGLSVIHHVLTTKMELSADVAERWDPDIARQLRKMGRVDVPNASNADRCREVEALAASVYFGAWNEVTIRFCPGDVGRVPGHWTRFESRNSKARGKRTTKQRASNPINAILNYLYTVAATECRIACFALGLEPTLGFLHSDAPNRDSLVWDLMETIRPTVETWALDLFKEHTFSRGDFVETEIGSCRIETPLLYTLAATGPLWARAVAPHAEHITHIIAKSSPYPIRCTTPLTVSKMRTAQGKRAYQTVDPYAHRAAFPERHSCVGCGIAA